MTNQDPKATAKKSENDSVLQTQEARVIMYIVPALLILGILAYLLKQ